MAKFFNLFFKILAALAGVAALVICESVDTKLNKEITSLCDSQHRNS